MRAPSRARRLGWVIAIVVSLCACGSDDPRPQAVGIRAEGCRAVADLGSGLAIGPDLVLTSAHTVAGASDLTVLIDAKTTAPATVVAFDPSMDLAYLRTSGDAAIESTRPVISSEQAEPGVAGRALVFRDGAATEVDVEIRRRVVINTEDIYVEEGARRPGFEISADIQLGDSGGAVLVGGEVIAIVWARTRDFDDDRFYAIDVSRARGRIDAQLAAGDLGPEVDLSRCT